MATVEWVGATSGDVSVATNYAGGVAPVATDSVVAQVTPVNPMTTGTFPALADFTTTAAYNADIGNSSGQPSFGNVTGVMKLGHRGNSKISSSGTITRLKAELTAGQTCTLLAGTTTRADVTGHGELVVGASAVLTNGYLIAGAKLTAEANGTAITLLDAGGQSVANVTGRNITTADVRDSFLTTKTTTAVATGTFSGRSIYNKQTSATDTTIDAKDHSIVTPSGKPYNAATDITTLNLWSTATLVEATAGTTLTVGTKNIIGATGASQGSGGGLQN